MEMIMSTVQERSTFNVGDIITCVCDEGLYVPLLSKGVSYVVAKPSYKYLGYEYVELVGVEGEHWVRRFKSLKDATNTTLTPDEVWVHLGKGTQLQIYTGASGWVDVVTPKDLRYSDILESDFRVKPEPITIEINGKRYTEILD